MTTLDTMKMTAEQQYLFDLQGYVVLKNVVPQTDIDAALQVLDRLKDMPEENKPDNVNFFKEDWISGRFVTNVIEADPALRPFMSYPEITSVIESVSGESWRLNHTAALIGNGAGHTKLHMGGTPLIFKCQYHTRDNKIFSTLTKAVFPLLPCKKEDGCFAVIPGSHKSAFPRPWSDHPEDNPALVPVETEPGDAVIFTEALTHGSTVNTSGHERRTLYYCYSVGYMCDWHNHALSFSDPFIDDVTDEQRQILALK